MTSQQYWHDLSLITTDLEKGLQTFYIHRFINQAAVQDKAVSQMLNRRAWFWNMQMLSLQTTLFIVLGRIFDHTAHSIKKVMTATLEHPELFSREALYARRLGDGPKPDWLENFITEAHEPTIKELQSLETKLQEWTDKFDQCYRPLRNKVFAHRALKQNAAVNKLAQKTNVNELEQLLLFLYDLTTTLEDMFNNGQKPELGNRPFVGGEEIKGATDEILQILSVGYNANKH